MSVSSTRTKRTYILSIVVFLLSIVALIWVNYRFAVQNPGGNDFLPRWYGIRSYVLNGVSPYSAQTTSDIQKLMYGRNAQTGEDQALFVYPFYAFIMFFPFSLVEEYALARALWMAFLEANLIGLAFFSMRMAGWRPSLWLLPFYFLYSMLWYHGLRPLINGNAIVVIALLIVAASAVIRDRKDISAGVLLSLATIKPHLVILPIAFIFLWAISHRRWSLIGWTSGSVILWVVLGMFFIPDWLLQNLWQVISYPGYTPALSFGQAFQEWWPGIGTQLKWGLAIFLTIILIVEWRSAWGKSFPHFLWTLCLTLTVSQWIGIATDPGNFILLFFPLVLIFSVLQERWNRGGHWIVLAVMVVLFVGLWAIFLNTVVYGDQPQQHSVMFLPMPLFILIGLYWIRWWALRPTRYVVNDSRSKP